MSAAGTGRFAAATCSCTVEPQDAVADGSGGCAPVWAPPECTLPVSQQPAREAEFSALFAAAVREMARPEPGRLRLVLDPSAEAAARDLAARESGCCSFFSFAFTRRFDRLQLEITVPGPQVAVLDRLAGEAAAALVRARR